MISAHVTKTMASAYAVLFSIQALCFAITGAMTAVEWGEISTTARFLIVVAIIGGWATTMLGFLSKTMARLEEGKPIIPTGDEPKVETK